MLCVLWNFTQFLWKTNTKWPPSVFNNICNFVHFTWLCIEIMDIKQNLSSVLYEKNLYYMKNEKKWRNTKWQPSIWKIVGIYRHKKRKIKVKKYTNIFDISYYQGLSHRYRIFYLRNVYSKTLSLYFIPQYVQEWLLAHVNFIWYTNVCYYFYIPSCHFSKVITATLKVISSTTKVILATEEVITCPLKMI